MKYLAYLALSACAFAQEAESGFDVRGSFTAAAIYSHLLSEAPRYDSPLGGGFQSFIYPTWKINSHWSVSGAIQIRSQPYFREELNEVTGRDVKADVLQANLIYSRISNRGALTLRVGQMTSAFGSFLLRYDPSVNPLTQMPLSYGYYYKPVSSLGLLGAQADVTLGDFDFRAQLTNSSPANARTAFDTDQYANWTAGAGYTIRQGLRIGASAYRGPYLHRDYQYFFPGEWNPVRLPATAFGVDIQWGQGPWNASGEWQHFLMTYHAIPNYTQHNGYAELRRTITPRWYAATRLEYQHPGAFPGSRAYEVAVGFRPDRSQVVKAGYAIQQGSTIRGTLSNVFTLQWVANFHLPSITGN